jgi:predicted thioesterase
VRIVAEVEAVRGNKVTCKMTAYSGPRVLGHGRTVQAVLPKDRLEELIGRS